MAIILSGKEVGAAIRGGVKETIKKRKLSPGLRIVRVGDRTDDLAYQKSLEKICEETGVACTVTALTRGCNQQALEEGILDAATDESVHGILLFSPLPEGYDSKSAVSLIPTAKDVDCLNPRSAGAVFTGDSGAFAPCTASAVMELLKYYVDGLEGKNIIVVGRSQVVGKPLSMLLLRENATVTIAHSRSVNLPTICRRADIVITAIGRARMLRGNYFTPGQVVIDVGINADPDDPKKICGDVDYAAVEPIVEAITPVPGGVGAVTSAILVAHVMEACIRMSGAPHE
jgi:methylenetetrahydrofolate dehydrogenase (NADP+)/methenyltetrahydrofolate cyclohydrolase